MSLPRIPVPRDPFKAVLQDVVRTHSVGDASVLDAIREHRLARSDSPSDELVLIRALTTYRPEVCRALKEGSPLRFSPMSR